MFLTIHDLLDSTEIAAVRRLSDQVQYVDGRISNPANAAKRNLQPAPNSAPALEAGRLVIQALLRRPDVESFAAPVQAPPAMIVRYQPGMAYGLHSDRAFMPVGQAMLRSDVACTVFLNDPADYQGGELSVSLGGRSVEFKMPAGSAVLYPATTLHEVRPVTAGERLVAITFMQSRIADPGRRGLLYDLNEVLAFHGEQMPMDARIRLEHLRFNLQRLWSAGGA